MAKIRCLYCHELIAEAVWPAHEAMHLAPRADGQQTDYATLPPEERETGDVDHEPSVYVHGKCGEATQMPEEIIRSYLKDPWLYMADTTYCCGCQQHVPFRACCWVDTGEDLQSYMDRLRAAKPELKPQGCVCECGHDGEDIEEDLRAHTDPSRAARQELKPKGCLGTALILVALTGAVVFL